jgi:hypothetical protein
VKILQTIFITSILVFALVSTSNAQLVKLGAGGGITQITGPEGLTNDVSEGGAGYSTEWNVGGLVKVDLPLIPITPRGFILYHSLSGSGEYSPELFKSAQAEGDLEISQSVLEIGVGAQYNFIPAPLGFDPYLALDLSLNSFGKTKINDNEVDGSDVSRFGGGIGIGSEITLIPMINLDLYLSYKILNLTGKEEGEETVGAVTLDLFVILNLL